MWALASALCISASLWGQQDVEKAKLELEKAGFANVRVAQQDSLTVFTIQNDAYKLQASGIAAAVKLLTEQGMTEGGTLKLIVTDHSVPQVSLTYDPTVGDWEVSHRVDRKSWKLVRRQPKGNNSLGKIDITVYPQISLMNLIITQVYQSLWQLSPAIELEPWPGAKFSYMMKFPIYNDGYGPAEDKIHPGIISLSQNFRIPGDIMGKATVGVFSNSRYGAVLSLSRRFAFNPRFWVEGWFGMLGLCYWEGFNFHMDPKFKPYFGVGAGYYWPKAETAFIVRVQKHLLDDYAIKAEMNRHFRYCTIGFYAEKGLNSYAKTNGGFRFVVELPPYRFKRYKYVPRVNLGSIGMGYNANNEQKWYRESKFEQSDNIMSSNAYNPYYIKKELKKLNK